MARRLVPQLILISALLFTAACAGPLFKVKPVTQLPPLPTTAKVVDAGGVAVRVAPLLTDEESQELFQANLPVIGMLPLRLEMDFPSSSPVELKKVKFKLHDGQNREWKLLSTKSAVSRILKGNEIRLYNPNFRKQFETDFGAYEFDLKTPLSPSDSQRRGFLFFQTPDKRPVETTQLTLTIERLPQPVTIALN